MSRSTPSSTAHSVTSPAAGRPSAPTTLTVAVPSAPGRYSGRSADTETLSDCAVGGTDRFTDPVSTAGLPRSPSVDAIGSVRPFVKVTDA